MDDKMFLALGVGVVIVLAVAILVKSMLKFVLIGAVVYFLFHLGFVWGVDDLNNKLHLSRWFNDDANKSIQTAYEDFTEKRDEYGVINKDEVMKVKQVIDDSIQKALTEAKNQYDSIDKVALLQELQAKLKEYEDALVNEAINESQDELETVMTTEEVNSLKTQP